jgi:hypothetical protein
MTTADATKVDAPADVTARTDVKEWTDREVLDTCIRKDERARRELHRRYAFAAGWPRLRRALQRRAPSILALWHRLTDLNRASRWQDIGDSNTNQVLARGGDVVAVSFVTAEGDHA